MKTITKRQATVVYKGTFSRNLLGVYDRRGQLFSLMLSIGESAKLGKSSVSEAGKTFNPIDMDLQLAWPEKDLKYDIKLATFEGEASKSGEQDLELFFAAGDRLLAGVKTTDNPVAVLNHEFTYDIHGDVVGGSWKDMVDGLFPGSMKVAGYETLTKTGGFIFKRGENEWVRIYLERSFIVENGIFLRTVFVLTGDVELAIATAAWRRTVALLCKEFDVELR